MTFLNYHWWRNTLYLKVSGILITAKIWNVLNLIIRQNIVLWLFVMIVVLWDACTYLKSQANLFSLAPNIQWEQMTLKVEGDPGYGSLSAAGRFTELDSSETVPLLIPDIQQQRHVWKPLSRKELEKCAGGPEWKKFRSRLVLCFWIGWLIMLGTAIAIIIQSPRTESPSLHWWQRDVFYCLQPALFMDADSDEVSRISSEFIKTSFTAATILLQYDCIYCCQNKTFKPFIHPSWSLKLLLHVKV